MPKARMGRQDQEARRAPKIYAQRKANREAGERAQIKESPAATPLLLKGILRKVSGEIGT